MAGDAHYKLPSVYLKPRLTGCPVFVSAKPVPPPPRMETRRSVALCPWRMLVEGGFSELLWARVSAQPAEGALPGSAPGPQLRLWALCLDRLDGLGRQGVSWEGLCAQTLSYGSPEHCEPQLLMGWA